MKKILVLLVAVLIKTSLAGQVINLKQKKADSDIKVINGDYQLFFKKTDVVDAINYADKILATNNSAIIESLKSDKIKVIDFKSPSSENMHLKDLIEKNIGLYLLLKGKVAVYKGPKQIGKLIQEQAPDEVELDGTRRTVSLFTDGDSDKQVFLGWMNVKLLEK